MMRPPIFFGNIIKGRIKLDNRDRFSAYLQSFEGKRVELILKERSGQRSDEQNKYYWGVVVPMIADYLGYTNEEMHEEIKKKFNIPSTSKLKTKEFIDFLSKVVRWAAIEFNVVIPDPQSVDY